MSFYTTQLYTQPEGGLVYLIPNIFEISESNCSQWPTFSKIAETRKVDVTEVC